MNFIENRAYTRKDIHGVLGGGIQDYLPHSDGVVVCACLTRNLNPLVPEKILVGSGPDVVKWGNVFSRQTTFVPVFIKTRPNEWIYYGRYRVDSTIHDRAVIAQYAKQAGRDNVTMILCLTKEGKQITPTQQL